jgi:2-phosphoglycerate kinase
MSTEPQIQIKGKPDQLFSRGLLSKKLELLGFRLSDGYEFSIQVHNELIKLKKKAITKKQLDEIVSNLLIKNYTKRLADQYRKIENWRDSNIPLWIFISGAIGVGKSTISRQIAGDLGIQHVVGTGIVRGILQKVLSADIMPELHSSSYNAFQKLRPIYSSRFEEVILGFENHSKFVNIGVEAVLSRAETESVSIVIEGEHLLPAFYEDTILRKPNVLYVTIATPDESLHKENLSAQYTKEKEELLNHFEQIRKIHDHLVNEAEIRKLNLVLSERGKKPIGEIRKLVVEKITSLIAYE